MEAHPHRHPVRCAACEQLYYPTAISDYLCDICQPSLETYVASMGGQPAATLAWWRQRQALRDGARRASEQRVEAARG